MPRKKSNPHRIDDASEMLPLAQPARAAGRWVIFDPIKGEYMAPAGVTGWFWTRSLALACVWTVERIAEDSCRRYRGERDSALVVRHPEDIVRDAQT